MYKATRDWENLERAFFVADNEFNIPKLRAVKDCAIENWIGFNYAKSTDRDERQIHGVHFYLDDYQFTRVWNDPDRYSEMLFEFGAVSSPDFSMYTDFPKAIQVYNCYRSHWLGRYWQDKGISVIPNIVWSDHASYDYCFDGDPVESVVMVSSTGTQGNKKSKQLFIDGYKEMMARLRPVKIYIYGAVPDECFGNIVHISTFAEQLEKRVSEHALL